MCQDSHRMVFTFLSWLDLLGVALACRISIRKIVNLLLRKIEKVPRGNPGEKSSKDMANSRNLVSTIGAQASPTMGDGTRCPDG